MVDTVDQGALTPEKAVSRWEAALANAARAAGPPLLFGLRLWASVCLALYVAFWLELDNASWAGTSAALVCQPLLGASLRKGWFRMIGTLVGAVAIVALTACFPQNSNASNRPSIAVCSTRAGRLVGRDVECSSYPLSALGMTLATLLTG
jgi:hypothetical protein